MLKMKEIDLVSASFEVKSKKRQPVNVQLLDFRKVSDKKENKKFRIKYRLSFSIQPNNGNFFLLNASFDSVYECDDAGKALLKEHIIIAHAVSYLREFVSNMTMRSSLPTIVIDPANAMMLLNEYMGNEKKS